MRVRDGGLNPRILNIDNKLNAEYRTVSKEHIKLFSTLSTNTHFLPLLKHGVIGILGSPSMQSMW